jgi:hypothetical protein
MAAQGKDHWVILRALAFKWIRVLWKCWATNTIYDEPKYLRQLHRRKSPTQSTIKNEIFKKNLDRTTSAVGPWGLIKRRLHPSVHLTCVNSGLL